MRTSLIAVSIMLIAGCATTPQNTLDFSHVSIIPSDESRAHPDYQKHFDECDWYATSDKVGIGKAATGGAMLGAGIFALTGLLMGVDSLGSLAAVGALHGGLGAGGAAKMTNDQRYKQVMTQCLRDKGHHVY